MGSLKHPIIQTFIRKKQESPVFIFGNLRKIALIRVSNPCPAIKLIPGKIKNLPSPSRSFTRVAVNSLNANIVQTRPVPYHKFPIFGQLNIYFQDFRLRIFRAWLNAFAVPSGLSCTPPRWAKRSGVIMLKIGSFLRIDALAKSHILSPIFGGLS